MLLSLRAPAKGGARGVLLPLQAPVQGGARGVLLPLRAPAKGGVGPWGTGWGGKQGEREGMEGRWSKLKEANNKVATA